MTARGGDYFR